MRQRLGPLTKHFDKINYYYPSSRRPLEDYQNNIPIDGNLFL